MLFKGKNTFSFRKREVIHWLCVAVGRNSLWSTHTSVCSVVAWERSGVRDCTPCPGRALPLGLSESLWDLSSPVPILWHCLHLLWKLFSETSCQDGLWGAKLRPQHMAGYKTNEVLRYGKSDLEVLISEKFPVLICSGFLPLWQSSFCLHPLVLSQDHNPQSKRTAFQQKPLDIAIHSTTTSKISVWNCHWTLQTCSVSKVHNLMRYGVSEPEIARCI